MQAQKLTSLQLELLKLFSYPINNQQLSEIKDILAEYFANQATQEMDKLWEANEWTDDTMDEWLDERLKTPYHQS